MKKQIFFCLEYPKNGITATTGRGENMAYKNIKLRGCDSAKIEQLIVTKSTKGAGTESDPYREVTQYWTLDGKLLFEDDQG